MISGKKFIKKTLIDIHRTSLAIAAILQPAICRLRIDCCYHSCVTQIKALLVAHNNETSLKLKPMVLKGNCSFYRYFFSISIVTQKKKKIIQSRFAKILIWKKTRDKSVSRPYQTTIQLIRVLVGHIMSSIEVIKE